MGELVSIKLIIFILFKFPYALIFGHVRIEGKEMWTWRSLGPACSLQAQDQPFHIEKLKKIINE